MSAPETRALGSHKKDPGSSIRLLVVADAAVAEVDGLPPAARAVIDDAADVYVLTPTLPGRLEWLADEGFGWVGATAGGVDFFELDRAAAEAGGRTAEEGVRLALQAGLEAEPLAVEAAGPVPTTIVEIADRHNAEVVVMGSRGLTGVRSMLLGSVSNAVVHHADRPTLIIRRQSEEQRLAA
jgi:nucleotide-binding universal stress UspA family protein